METVVRTGTPTVTLKQQGDSITGHYSSQVFGETDFKGTVKDTKINFSFKADIQGTSLVVTYSGNVESNDAMKGTSCHSHYFTTFRVKRDE